MKPAHPKAKLINEMVDLHDHIIRIAQRLKEESIVDTSKEIRTLANTVLDLIDEIGERYARKEA